MAKELWSYDKEIRKDKQGVRWHFVKRDLFDERPYEDQPFELYFRNDDRTEFGVLRFERRKDNPYRDYQLMIKKIMNNLEFRRSLAAPETAEIWRASWK